MNNSPNIKYQFKSEKAKNDFLIETVLGAVKKARDGGYSPKTAFERDCVNKGWVALSMIKNTLTKGKGGLRFCNALSDLPDNADKEERLLELLLKIEKIRYFRLGGSFNKKYYFYRISKWLEIDL